MRSHHTSASDASLNMQPNEISCVSVTLSNANDYSVQLTSKDSVYLYWQNYSSGLGAWATEGNLYPIVVRPGGSAQLQICFQAVDTADGKYYLNGIATFDNGGRASFTITLKVGSPTTTPPPAGGAQKVWFFWECGNQSQIDDEIADNSSVIYAILPLTWQISSKRPDSYYSLGCTYNTVSYYHSLGVQVHPILQDSNGGNEAVTLVTGNNAGSSSGRQAYWDNLIGDESTQGTLLYDLSKGKFDGLDLDFEPSTNISDVSSLYGDFLDYLANKLHGMTPKRSLTVEFDHWNPRFWNLSTLGNTSADVLSDMGTYCPSGTGTGSFSGTAAKDLSTLPLSKIGIGIKSPCSDNVVAHEVQYCINNNIPNIFYFAMPCPGPYFQAFANYASPK